MSAIIQTEKLKGVSTNALHLANGEIQVVGIEVTRKAVHTKTTDTVTIASQLLNLEENNFTKQLEAGGSNVSTELNGDEFFVLNNRHYRSVDTVELRFPPLAEIENQADMAELKVFVLNNLVTPKVSYDYEETPQAVFDFDGVYDDEEGTPVFKVSAVSKVT